MQAPAQSARPPQSVRTRDGSAQVATLRATKASTLDLEEGPRPLGAARQAGASVGASKEPVSSSQYPLGLTYSPGLTAKTWGKWSKCWMHAAFALARNPATHTYMCLQT